MVRQYKIVSSKMQFISQIKEEQKAQKIDEISSWFIDYRRINSKIEIIIFKLINWIAIPVLNEDFFNWEEIEGIKNSLQSFGYKELYGIKLSDRYIYAYKVPLTIAGLTEWKMDLNPFDAALFAGESVPEWGIIALESEYYIIAGPVEFVSKILPYKIEEYRSRFENALQYSPYLKRVYDSLKNYQNAKEGDEFFIY